MEILDPAWLDHLILAREFTSPTARTRLYRGVHAGRTVVVAPGVFLPAPLWEQLDADVRYLAVITAARMRYPDESVFSHLSAAAMWGLPAVGPWPDRAEATAMDATGGRSRRGLRRRYGPVVEGVVMIDGVPVTPLARTLVDVARTVRPAASLAMLDFALRRSRDGASGNRHVTREELIAEVHLATGRRGHERAADMVRFADPDSASPGESVSRLAIRTLGYPAPELQREFRDRRGLIGYVDFWWAGRRVIGEFDGERKYVDPSMLDGRTTADVVLAEKERENRLRAVGTTVGRWGWSDAWNLRRLERRLHDAGLRR